MGNVWTAPENEDNAPQVTSDTETEKQESTSEMEASILESVLPEMARVEVSFENNHGLCELMIRFILKAKTIETIWPMLTTKELLRFQEALRQQTDFTEINYLPDLNRPDAVPAIYLKGGDVVLHSSGHISRLPRSVFDKPLLQAIDNICNGIVRK